MVSRLHEGEHCDRHYVVKGHTCNDHQRCHAGVSVKILDNGNAKDCCAAPVRGLHKFAPDVSWLQKKGEANGDSNAAKGGDQTEENKFGIPYFHKIRFRHIQE